MTANQVTILGVVVAVLGSVVVSTVTARATRVAARTAADAGAYERAKSIYEGAIGQLQRELADLRSQVLGLTERTAAQGKSLRQYEGRVIQLQEILRAHGIAVPPWNSTSVDGSAVDDPQPGPDIAPYVGD